MNSSTQTSRERHGIQIIFIFFVLCTVGRSIDRITKSHDGSGSVSDQHSVKAMIPHALKLPFLGANPTKPGRPEHETPLQASESVLVG